jgi:hypothetical protein
MTLNNHHPKILEAMAVAVKWADNTGVSWNDLSLHCVPLDRIEKGGDTYRYIRCSGYMCKILSDGYYFGNGRRVEWGAQSPREGLPRILNISIPKPAIIFIATIHPAYDYVIPGLFHDDGTPVVYADLPLDRSN